MSIVLDAGALIALERNERAMWATLQVARRIREAVLVPSTVLAQVWRGRSTQARLAMALEGCLVAGFDEHARAVGLLLGETNTRDVCDAHVALVVRQHAADAIYTSDLDDLGHLLAALDTTAELIHC